MITAETENKNPEESAKAIPEIAQANQESKDRMASASALIKP